MPESTSVFFSGMNMDTPAEYMKQGQYVKAQNVRIRSLNGNNYVVETITGNKKQCVIPDIPAYGYKFCLDLSIPFSVTLSLPLFAVTYGALVTNLYGAEEASTYTAEQQNNLTEITTLLLTNDNVDEWVSRVNELYGFQLVQIDSRCDNTICLRMIFRTLKSRYIIPNGNGSIQFVGTNPPFLSTLFESQTVQDIIGYKESSTELILFTTNAKTPEDNPNSIGSIWRVDISGIDDLPTQNYAIGSTDLSLGLNTLVYSDYLGFYRSHQITDAEYIIESECSKFILWTDNYNPPRILSVGSSGLNITQPSLLSFSPEYELGSIEFNGYGTGKLPSGVYQYSYRCITADGIPSIWKPLSNHVICFGDSNGSYNQVFADTINEETNRSINITINNIDTRYTTIQVVALLFTAENQYPPVKTIMFVDQPISGATMSFNHKNMDLVYEDVSADSVLISKYIVSRAKNLIVVRDRLVLANICEKNCLDINISDIWNGEYEFITQIIDASFSNETYDYPFISYKNGKIEHEYRGYKRGELYRFGIIFYLKDGSTCFVEKLADIKFPEVYDPGYRLAQKVGDVTYVFALGIRFLNIDISSIQDKITGYSIVRAKRIPKIIGQGVSFPYFRNIRFNSISGGDIITWASGFTLPVFTNNITDNDQDTYQMIWSPDVDFSRFNYNGDLSFKLIGSLNKTDGIGYMSKLVDYTTSIIHNNTYSAGQLFSITQSEFIGSNEEYNQDTFLGIDNNMNQFQLVKCGTNYDLLSGYYQGVQRNGVSMIEIIDNSIDDNRYNFVNEYIECKYVSVCDNSNNITIWNGDIFVNLYTRIIGYTNGGSTTIPQRTVSYMCFPVESTVNTDLRYPDKDQTDPAAKIITEIVSNFNTYPTDDRLEAFNYFNAYSSETPQTFPARNPKLDSIECSPCFNTRFVASQQRLIGSNINQYTQLLVNEFIDAEYEYGEVVHVETLNDPDIVSQQLFFWQQRGFGFVPMNFKILARDAVQLVIGTGEVFQKVQYISKQNGTFHKHSVCKSSTSFYWYDQNTRRIMKYGRDGFGALPGIDTFITQYDGFEQIATIDNPVLAGGIISIYDPNYEEVLFTLLDPRDTENFDTGSWYNSSTFDKDPFAVEQPRFSKTFVYNERQDVNSWTHFLTHIPRMYMRITGNRILTLQSFPVFPFNVRQFQARLYQSYAGDNECIFGDFGSEPAFIKFYFFVPGGAKVTKVMKNTTIDSNKKWDVVLYETNEQHNWDDTNRINQTWTVPGLPFWQPRNGKWQGDIELVKKVVSENNDQQGLLKTMQGEWFTVTIVYPFSDFYDDKVNPGELIKPITKRVLRSVDFTWDITQRNR